MTKKKDKQASDSNQEAENKWEAFSKQEADSAEVSDAAAGPEKSGEDESLVTPGGIDFPDSDNSQILALQKQVDDYKDQVMRAHAEMENMRRRVERDIANARKFGSENLLQDLLPVVDSLVRGLETAQTDDPQAKGMREGMELTLGMLEKTLEKHGVVSISPEKGESFNPELHEAMSMQPDPDAASNSVIQVLQKGYQLNGRLLRAAMVIVAQ